MNCYGCGELESDGNEGDDVGSDLLRGDDAKMEMIEMVKIVVVPGGKVEMRLLSPAEYVGRGCWRKD
jgi:hypothetical protein